MNSFAFCSNKDEDHWFSTQWAPVKAALQLVPISYLTDTSGVLWHSAMHALCKGCLSSAEVKTILVAELGSLSAMQHFLTESH